jgi:hypothetical protein
MGKRKSFLALRCFILLTSSYHEMESGEGIKKSASRITNHWVRMAGLASQRVCTSCHTHTKWRGTSFFYEDSIPKTEDNPYSRDHKGGFVLYGDWSLGTYPGENN